MFQYLYHRPNVQAVREHAISTQHDTNLDPEAQERTHPVEFPALDTAQQFLDHATERAAQGDDVAACEAYQSACQLAPTLAQRHEDRILAAYRPGDNVLPNPAVKEILRRHITALGQTPDEAELQKAYPGQAINLPPPSPQPRE